MVDLLQFSLVDRSQMTKNYFCPTKFQRKENQSVVSKIFHLFTLFTLLVWLQNAFQPANAAIIPTDAREKRSPPFSIDSKNPTSKDQTSELTGIIYKFEIMTEILIETNQLKMINEINFFRRNPQTQPKRMDTSC